MRITANSLKFSIAFCVSLATFDYAWALDTSREEMQCTSIGFTKGTEAFGACVLELMDRKNNQLGSVSLSPDEELCINYGFKPQTSAYAECRQKLDMARKEASQLQAQREAQIIALKRERDRQIAQKQLDIGLRMMNGQSVVDAVRGSEGLPSLQTLQQPINQTLMMPNGKLIHCNTTGNLTNCF